MPNILPRLTIWDRWRELTQFLHLTDHLLQTQSAIWQSLPLDDKDNVKLIRDNSPYHFRTTGSIYQRILNDRHMLASVVLLHSYALIESATQQVIYNLQNVPKVVIPVVKELRANKIILEDITDSGGIEAWGTKLLIQVGRDWNAVEGKLSGVVEAAVVRNAIAHGAARVTPKMHNRVTAVGGTLPWNINAVIRLDIPILTEYRHRLRSFARVFEHGAEMLVK